MGLLAAVKALLSRYSHQNDIIIGSPVAGRDHLDLEGQIGLFVNTLALRTKMDASDTFSSLFSKVKEVTIAGYSHQMYAFDELVSDLTVSRDASRSPLFDIMVLLNPGQDAADSGFFDLPGVAVRSYDIGLQSSQFDLTFEFSEEAEGESGLI